jgi:hypothetical protein
MVDGIAPIGEEIRPPDGERSAHTGSRSRGSRSGGVRVGRRGGSNVPQLEDVAGLSHVGDRRVVAPIFPVMRLEAAEGPADRGSRADDRSLDVDRQALQIGRRQRLGHDVAVNGDERGEGLLGELARPAAGD